MMSPQGQQQLQGLGGAMGSLGSAALTAGGVRTPTIGLEADPKHPARDRWVVRERESDGIASLRLIWQSRIQSHSPGWLGSHA